MVKDTITGEGSKNYSFNNYNQYCLHRLPCGICTRTNQMCPIVGNRYADTTPITNPQDWYNYCTTDSSRNDPNITLRSKN